MPEADETSTAIDHQESRLYSILCPAPHHPSLRPSNHTHCHLRHYRRKVPPQKRLYRDLVSHWYNRLHHSACQQTSHSSSCRKLRRYLLRCSRYLPFHSPGSVTSGHQCIWPDETSYSDSHANHNRQFGCDIGHAAVQN